jgi:hypothetical protein
LPVDDVVPLIRVPNHEMRVSGLKEESASAILRLSLSLLPALLAHDKSRSGIQGFEILEERHQLDRKQGIHDPGFKKIVIVVQIGNINRAQQELGNGFPNVLFFFCIRGIDQWVALQK